MQMPHFIGKIIGRFAIEKLNQQPMPEKLPKLSVTPDQFAAMTSIVIDNFEGGYYHPSMLKNFKPSDQAVLKDSGETMFGLDRMAGAQLAKYPEWKTFWDMVDADRKINTFWKYQYRGGKLEPRLKELTSIIMYKWFSYLAGKYILISSMDEIANDNRLIVHFIYASWNGEGWFQKYAKALNAAILKFEGNKEAIFNEAIKARTLATNKLGLPNRAIRQQGQHMMELFKRLKWVQ